MTATVPSVLRSLFLSLCLWPVFTSYPTAGISSHSESSFETDLLPVNTTEHFASFLSNTCEGFSDAVNVEELSLYFETIGAKDVIHLTEMDYEDMTHVPMLQGRDRIIFIDCLCRHLDENISSHILTTRQEREAEAFMRGGEYVPPPNPFVRSEETANLCRQSGWSEQRRLDILRQQQLKGRGGVGDSVPGLEEFTAGGGDVPMPSAFSELSANRLVDMQRKLEARQAQEKIIAELKANFERQRWD